MWHYGNNTDNTETDISHENIASLLDYLNSGIIVQVQKFVMGCMCIFMLLEYNVNFDPMD